MYGPGSPSAKAGNGEIWVSAVHPGLVQTNLTEVAVVPGWFDTFFAVFGRFVSVDADTGSFTSLFCAASPEMKVEQSGMYFQRLAEEGWQSGNAKDVKLAERLEEWTAKQMSDGGWMK